MTVYQKFKKLSLDFSSLGLEQGETRSDYFCTPKGAKIIGWAGVDGIHYCFVREFGEMVFAVCPMNLPGEYVRPIARDFTDFLRLLLACRHASALDQAPMWKERSGLENFVAGIESSPALEVIKNTFSLEEMPDPWGYMKALREATDLSALKFPPEYAQYVPSEPDEPVMPDWRVYFCGNFFDDSAGRRPGKEFAARTEFDFEDQHWIVPGVYSCSGGLVMDFAIRVEPEELFSYMMGKTSKNPLSMKHLPDMTLMVDGKETSFNHSSGLWWVPEAFEDEKFFADQRGKWIVSHYGLSEDYGWSFIRASFRWEKKPRTIRSLELSMVYPPERAYLPISPEGEGQQIGLKNPFTGKNHTLTVLGLTDERLDDGRRFSAGYELPGHYRKMTYSLTPDLPDKQFGVVDQLPNDQPRLLPNDNATVDGSMGIIGGSDGPTSVIFSVNVKKSEQENDLSKTAISSLHFSPPVEVCWTAIFREDHKQPVSVHIELIKID